MLPEIEKLLVLQDRDRRIRTLKTEQKNLPLERRELEAKLAGANTGAEQAKQRMRELEVQKGKLSSEAQGKRDQIAKFKTQQMETRKNEEYQALTNAIGHFEKEVQKIEDAELEVMEQIETHLPLLAAAEKAAAGARGLVASQIADLEAKGTTLAANLGEVEKDRAGLTAGIDEDLLNLYNRLFTTKEGNAVVALENEVCSGCHMRLTAQTIVRVKGEREITQCEQCGRILYLPR